MRVRLDDPTKLGELASYLRRCGCAVSVVDGGALDARIPATRDPSRSRPELELDAYLRVWTAMHAGATAMRAQARR